jgi:hypothetical protein
MGQRKAHQWLHVLVVVRQATLRTLGDAPTRSLTELAKRLGGADVAATALVVPTSEPLTPVELPTPAPASPL